MEKRLKKLVEMLINYGESWIQFTHEKPVINGRNVDFFAPSGKHQFTIAYEGTIDEVKIPVNVITDAEMDSLEKCIQLELI